MCCLNCIKNSRLQTENRRIYLTSKTPKFHNKFLNLSTILKTVSDFVMLVLPILLKRENFKSFRVFFFENKINFEKKLQINYLVIK